MGQEVYIVTHQVDDFDIQALVDCQLGGDDKKRVWQEIEHNPRLYKRYNDLMTQKKLLFSWWKEEDAARELKSFPRETQETLLV